MKIEKGKLYYDNVKKEVFLAPNEAKFIGTSFISNKIAVYFTNNDDYNYIVRILNLKWVFKMDEGVIYLDRHCHSSINYAKGLNYHIITIDQFKEFYPEEPKEISLPIVDNTNIDNIIEALKIQTQLEYSIESIERELSRLKELKQKINNILK